MQHPVSPSTQKWKQLICGKAAAGAALWSNNVTATAREDVMVNFMLLSVMKVLSTISYPTGEWT
jgi:hypothetical protein